MYRRVEEVDREKEKGYLSAAKMDSQVDLPIESDTKST